MAASDISLDEAIAQLVENGSRDPAQIVRSLLEDYESRWLRDQLIRNAGDLLREYVRRSFWNIRAKAEREPDSAAATTAARVWVPGTGWKRRNDITADDLRARADWYDSAAMAATMRADWCRQVANLMDSQGVKRLGELRDIPSLDSAGEIAA